MRILVGRAAIGAALVMAFAPVRARAQATPPAVPAADDGAKARAPSALFASDSVLRFTIVADWKTIAKQRDTLNPKTFPGRVTVATDDGVTKTMPVGLQTRGHFRLQKLSCDVPPLRVDFGDAKPGGTPFRGQRALKLVTHCRHKPDDFEEYVVREWVVYRMQELVGEPGFRARLARVRYVDAGDTTKGVERWGMFLESEREMGRRLGGEVLDDVKGGGWMDVEPDSGAGFATFQYLIGNNDWSISYLHNVRIVATPQGTRAVGYDFDFSGMVSAVYAGPSPGLPIKTTRERLWRGPCFPAEKLAPTLTRFGAQRAPIETLVRDTPGLDGGYRGATVRWLNEFWDLSRDPRRFTDMVRRTCDKY